MSYFDEMEQHQRNVIRYALRGSAEAIARVQGMKIRASLTPPRAAPWSFPYSHRKQSEVPLNGYVKKANRRG